MNNTKQPNWTRIPEQNQSEIQKCNTKSRNPTGNSEIQSEIQKSKEKSRNTSEIQKYKWNPEIHTKSRNPFEI